MGVLTPQELLKDYLDGIDDVLPTVRNAEDKKEILRQRMIFRSAIYAIDFFLNISPKKRNYIKKHNNEKATILGFRG